MEAHESGITVPPAQLLQAGSSDVDLLGRLASADRDAESLIEEFLGVSRSWRTAPS